jgi:hypothetical protein
VAGRFEAHLGAGNAGEDLSGLLHILRIGRIERMFRTALKGKFPLRRQRIETDQIVGTGSQFKMPSME